MSSVPLEIDTKGTCLLCLKPQSVFKRKRNGEGDCADSTRMTAFKMILRYLKVDITKLTHLSSSSAKSFGSENVNLLVTICDECSSIATSFLQLFKAFEIIRLQLDMRVHQLQQVMEKGVNDERRVREYDKRMSTGARKEMVNASMAQSLRNETLEKASTKLARSAPRINLHKQKVNPKSKASELEAVVVERESSTSRTRTSFPVHEVLPIPSSNMELGAQPNWNEEAVNEKDPLRMETDSSSEDDDKEESVNSDVSYCNDDDDPNSADKQSDREPPEEGDNESEKITLATGRRPYKLGYFHFQAKVDVATEKYYDKSRKCIRWKCNLCGGTCKSISNLRTHKLAKHMMTVIKDKLPDSVPEIRVILALDRLIDRTPVISKNRYGSPKHECLFCKKTEWSTLRAHLLKFHLDKVIAEVEDCKDTEIDAPVRSRYRRTDGKLPASRSRILKFKCDKCGARLSSALAVKQHKIKEHPETSNYFHCDYCPERLFTHDRTLRVHRMRSHPTAFFGDKLPPGISDEGFNEALHCILGMAKEIGNSFGNDLKERERVFECPYCGERSTQSSCWSIMRIHILKFHLEEVIEEATGGGFNVPGDIQNPQLKTESEPMTAEGIDFSTNGDPEEGFHPGDMAVDDDGENDVMGEMKDDLESNKVSVNPNQPRSPAKKKVTLLHNSDQRVGHLRKIKQGHKCDHCGMNFFVKHNLQIHEISKHTMIVLKDRLPPSMSKEDVTKGLNWILTKSEKSCEPDKQASFKCFFCKKRARSPLYKVHLLKAHLDEVVKEIDENKGDPSFKTSREYPCRICRERFVSYQTLMVHKGEKHTWNAWTPDEGRAFPCHYCNKYFVRAASMQAHLALQHPAAYYVDCMPAGVSDEEFSDVVTAMTDKVLEIGKQKGRFSCIHCDKCFDKMRSGNDKRHECRLHLTRVHLNKVIEELKKRKESVVETAENSSDNPTTDQVQEKMCEDMDCGNESGPGSGSGG